MFALTPIRLMNELARNNFNDIWTRDFTQQNFIAVRTWEENDHFYVEADMPGVAKESVEVSLLDENTLSIAATRQETKTKGTNHYKEAYYGRIERTLSLPCSVTEDGCDAVLKDGVLRLQFNKTKSKVRRIEIKTNKDLLT